VDDSYHQSAASEASAHAYVNDSNALAPRWFKQSVLRSLKGNSVALRASPAWSLMHQFPLLARAIYLSLLMFPFVSLSVIRLSTVNLKPSQIVWVTIASYPAVAIVGLILKFITDTLVFIATGLYRYVPWQFAEFLTFVCFAFMVAVVSFVPLREALRHGFILKRSLGVAGLVLELFEVVFTIREIAKIVSGT
jgi:hypothetical protein